MKRNAAFYVKYKKEQKYIQYIKHPCSSSANANNEEGNCQKKERKWKKMLVKANWNETYDENS